VIACRTLGPVSAEVNGAGAPVELMWRKNIGLLVYLARSPKRARSRDHLLGLFWSDKPEEDARKSLNQAVYTLRRYVGEDGIVSDAFQVALRPGAVTLDTDELEALFEKGDPCRAADLVQGEFLEGLAIKDASEFDNWLTAERSHWTRRSVEVLVACADKRLAAGALAEATRAAQAALERGSTPSNVALRTLMRCLALAEDPAGALKLYEDCAARLRAELGAEPDTETKALAERIRQGRTWRVREGARDGEVGSAESRRPPLVGRARELRELVHAWDECRGERRAGAAVIAGDAGMGKTRLAEELVARSRLDSAVVARARAVEADLGDGWSGVSALARGGLLEAPGVAAAPPWALAALRGGAPAEQLGKAFSNALAAVADEQPVVVYMDDAHWLDRESLLALGAAARDLSHAPVLFVFTIAQQPPRGEVDELRSRIGRELVGAGVQLGPLALDALRELARWALPRYTAVETDRVARRVATDSGGIPLLAVALFLAVASGYDLRESPGAWPRATRTLDETLPGDLPDAVVAAIRINFHRLSGDARRVLVGAAVLGGRVPRDRLARGAGLDGDALNVALDELEWRGWLASEPRGYGFVARIVRDVIERDMLTSAQRQRILDAAGRPS